MNFRNDFPCPLIIQSISCPVNKVKKLKTRKTPLGGFKCIFNGKQNMSNISEIYKYSRRQKDLINFSSCQFCLRILGKSRKISCSPCSPS